MNNYFVISINGQRAVSAAYALCNGKCYTHTPGHIAQIEVVIDEPGTYNGIPQKWVDASYIKSGKDVIRTLDALKVMGFGGCPCVVQHCTLCGSLEKQTELFCTII